MDTIKKQFDDSLTFLKIEPSETIIAAVSGGVDSVVLLDLLAKNGFKPIVAHLNHGVRKEANEDEEFVRSLADNYHLPFESKTIIPPKKGNLEEGLREERRAFLLDIAERYNANYVALAHNKNDQAETFLLNLSRGSGPAGLAGMEMQNGKVIRPLLDVSREEIESYATTNKLEWHEDETNKDTRYSRNYVRHITLPKLKKLNPDVVNIVTEMTKQARNIDKHYKNEAKKYLKASTNELRELPDQVLFEVFGTRIEQTKGDRKNLTFKNLTELKKLIESDEGTKEISLPGGLTAKRAYDKLDFYRKREDNTNLVQTTQELNFGQNRFGEWELTLEQDPFPEQKTKDNENNYVLYIDPTTFPSIFVRTKKEGDKIEKVGIEGHKKLQDLFTDAKIEKDKRAKWPVVTDINDEIIWVPGLALSRKAKTNQPRVKITARKVASEK